MDIHFSLFELIIILGITQGFITTALIWSDANRSASKLILSFVLAVFSLLCVKILILSSGLRRIDQLRYLPLAFDLVIQPLFYLYILALTKPGFRFRKKYWLHFIPFAVSFVYSVFVYLAVMTFHPLSSNDRLTGDFHFNAIKEIEDYLSILSSLVYWYAGFRRILAYRKWLYDNISDADYPTYSWLKNIALLFGILIVGLAIDILLDYFFGFGSGHFFHWQLFFVYLAALIYYMGFRGFRLPDKMLPAPQQNGQAQRPVILPSSFSASEKPQNTGHDILAAEEKAKAVKEAILRALETDKLYLDPELNLQTLAKKIGFPPAIVSSVINGEIRTSFRNLIHAYRIEAVKSRLQSPGADRLTLLGIAYECGFNSEASFYRVFKIVTGVTPGEYLKNRSS